MPKQHKENKVKRFRISLVDDHTHKQLWILRLSRGSLFITVLSAVMLLFVGIGSLLVFTPLKTFIPGYPDEHTKRAAISNAMKIDSLENVIMRWEFYSENLKRVIAGEDPIRIDSIIRNHAGDTSARSRAEDLNRSDSLLRKGVQEEEQFGLTQGQSRSLPIEGMHFFSPLKGVISQGYDKLLHPYIDITAPANSVVTSVLDGTVIGAGWSDESGYTIQVQHPDNVVSVYKHNQKLLKKTGDKVNAGAPIALVGNTGSLTTGDHLHFELWYKGEAVDPTKYINF